jgi:hypothetical protein
MASFAQLQDLREIHNRVGDMIRSCVESLIANGATWQEIAQYDKIQGVLLYRKRFPDVNLEDVRKIVNEFIANKIY